MDMKRCPCCDELKSHGLFSRNARNRDGLQSHCKACAAAQQRKRRAAAPGVAAAELRAWREKNPESAGALAAGWRARLTAEVVQGYGGRCSCCGESTPEFLTLDHVNGRGDDAGVHTYQVYLRARREGFPDRYRLLCFNCNCGRERNGGVCPHEMQRLSAAREEGEHGDRDLVR